MYFLRVAAPWFVGLRGLFVLNRGIKHFVLYIWRVFYTLYQYETLFVMTIDEFVKCDLRVGTILAASAVEGSTKLLKLSVDLGEKTEDGVSAPRIILSGIAASYSPDQLVGKQVAVVANLEPRTIMGSSSHGMVLASKDESGVVKVVTIDGPVASGAAIT